MRPIQWVQGCVLACACLAVSSLAAEEASASSSGNSYHGSLDTIYNPRRERVYRRQGNDFRSLILNPYLLEQAQNVSNPFQRYQALRFTLNYIEKNEGRLELIHAFYQSFNLVVTPSGSTKSATVVQGRYAVTAKPQPDASLRQAYYRSEAVGKGIEQIKVGRMLDMNAAGIAHYDGLSVQLGGNGFYLRPYSGQLIDDDYLHKNRDDVCSRHPIRSSCLLGTDYANEDYENQWGGSDVRNFSSRERRGDTINGVSAGYESQKLSVSADYQKKTDDSRVAEQLGGVEVFARPSQWLQLYLSGSANLMNGEQRSGLAGLSFLTDGWKFDPEYEYYKPQFKHGSFWEEFHAYGRASTRLKIYRFLGQNLRFELAGGRTRYLADDRSSSNLTTRTRTDPYTQETVGSFEKETPRLPTDPLHYLGYPFTVNPRTHLAERPDSRPMTNEELLVYYRYANDTDPGDGNEGRLGVYFAPLRNTYLRLDADYLDGPMGSVIKGSMGLFHRIGQWRLNVRGGEANFQSRNPERQHSENVSFFASSAEYFVSVSTRVSAGVEIMTGSRYEHNTRGLFRFHHDF